MKRTSVLPVFVLTFCLYQGAFAHEPEEMKKIAKRAELRGPLVFGSISGSEIKKKIDKLESVIAGTSGSVSDIVNFFAMGPTMACETIPAHQKPNPELASGRKIEEDEEIPSSIYVDEKRNVRNLYQEIIDKLRKNSEFLVKYREEVEGRAQQMYADIAGTRDPGQFEELILRYPLTKAAENALMRLVAFHSDRGEVLRAQFVLNHLVKNYLNDLPPRSLVQIAGIFHAMNQVESGKGYDVTARAIEDRLAQVLPDPKSPTLTQAQKDLIQQIKEKKQAWFPVALRDYRKNFYGWMKPSKGGLITSSNVHEAFGWAVSRDPKLQLAYQRYLRLGLTLPEAGCSILDPRTEILSAGNDSIMWQGIFRKRDSEDQLNLLAFFIKDVKSENWREFLTKIYFVEPFITEQMLSLFIEKMRTNPDFVPPTLDKIAALEASMLLPYSSDLLRGILNLDSYSWSSIQILKKIRPYLPGMDEEIAKALSGSDPAKVEAVLDHVQHTHLRSDRLKAAASQLLSHPSKGIQVQAVSYLMRVYKEDNEGLRGKLRALLGDKDWKHPALKLLDTLCESGKTFDPRWLFHLLTDADDDVREDAGAALGCLEKLGPNPLIHQAIHDLARSKSQEKDAVGDFYGELQPSQTGLENLRLAMIGTSSGSSRRALYTIAAWRSKFPSFDYSSIIPIVREKLTEQTTEDDLLVFGQLLEKLGGFDSTAVEYLFQFLNGPNRPKNQWPSQVIGLVARLRPDDARVKNELHKGLAQKPSYTSPVVQIVLKTQQDLTPYLPRFEKIFAKYEHAFNHLEEGDQPLAARLWPLMPEALIEKVKVSPYFGLYLGDDFKVPETLRPSYQGLIQKILDEVEKNDEKNSQPQMLDLLSQLSPYSEQDIPRILNALAQNPSFSTEMKFINKLLSIPKSDELKFLEHLSAFFERILDDPYGKNESLRAVSLKFAQRLVDKYGSAEAERIASNISGNTAMSNAFRTLLLRSIPDISIAGEALVARELDRKNRFYNFLRFEFQLESVDSKDPAIRAEQILSAIEEIGDEKAILAEASGIEEKLTKALSLNFSPVSPLVDKFDGMSNSTRSLVAGAILRAERRLDNSQYFYPMPLYLGLPAQERQRIARKFIEIHKLGYSNSDFSYFYGAEKLDPDSTGGPSEIFPAEKDKIFSWGKKAFSGLKILPR